MASPRRHILFIEQEIPHYRARVLTTIASAIDADFRFFHGTTTASQAFKEASAGDLPPNTNRIFVRWCLRDRIVLHNYWSALRQRKRGRNLAIVRHNPRSLFLLPFMLWCRLLRIPVVVWGQGYSRNRPFRPYTHPLDMLNLAICRLARAYVAYTDEIREQLSRYVDPRSIFTACNTLSLSHLVDIRTSLESESKTQVRARLGLHSGNYLVFIGRLQPRKRADLFIEALAKLQQADGLDIGGIIIGHGPEEGALRQLAMTRSVRDLHFTGALSDEEAANYLFAADVLVIPGWLGLAVNHAFFFGLPVVGQKFNGSLLHHGPEVAYIREGETGFLADAHTPNALVFSIRRAIENKQTMGRTARQYFDSHLDINRMADGFRRAIDLALPPEVQPIGPD
jgi:glycosyltransferase involved in cell wall biosynthesis